MLLINNLDSHQCRVVLDPLAEEGLVRSDHPAAGYNLQLLCRDFSKAGHLSVEISLSQRSRLMPSFQFVPGPTNLTPILKALYPPFSPIKQINLLQIKQTNKRNLSRPDQTQNFYLALETFSTAKLKICDTGFFEPEIFSIIDFTLDSSPPIPG